VLNSSARASKLLTDTITSFTRTSVVPKNTDDGVALLLPLLLLLLPLPRRVEAPLPLVALDAPPPPDPAVPCPIPAACRRQGAKPRTTAFSSTFFSFSPRPRGFFCTNASKHENGVSAPKVGGKIQLGGKLGGSCCAFGTPDAAVIAVVACSFVPACPAVFFFEVLARALFLPFAKVPALLPFALSFLAGLEVLLLLPRPFFWPSGAVAGTAAAEAPFGVRFLPLVFWPLFVGAFTSSGGLEGCELAAPVVFDAAAAATTLLVARWRLVDEGCGTTTAATGGTAEVATAPPAPVTDEDDAGIADFFPMRPWGAA